MAGDTRLGDLIRVSARLDVDEDAVAELFRFDIPELGSNAGPRLADRPPPVPSRAFEAASPSGPDDFAPDPQRRNWSDVVQRITRDRSRGMLRWFFRSPGWVRGTRGARTYQLLSVLFLSALAAVAAASRWAPALAPWAAAAAGVVGAVFVAVALVVASRATAAYLRRRREATVLRSRVRRQTGLPARASAGADGSDAITSVGSVWRTPPPPPPLVSQRTARAVVGALSSVEVPVGIDMSTLVEAAARRRPAVRSTRRGRWSATRGLDLMVDRSSAMEPYGADITDLERLARGVAGEGGLRVLNFDRDPRRVFRPIDDAWYDDDSSEFYDAGELRFRARTPVVVVTDLGIGTPRVGSVSVAPRRLLGHAARLRSAGLSPLYLTPYRAERWPAELRSLPIVVWDEALTSRAVRRVRELERW